MEKKCIAVLGGDGRQICLAQLLHEEGAEVMTWGLEKGGAPFGVPLDRALEAEMIVLPLPACRGEKLNLPLTDTELFARDLWKKLRRDQLIFVGMAESIPLELRREDQMTVLDYYSREELQIAGAAATAEGAIMRAMEETRGTLLGSECLVVGYGRIGKLLAHRLHGLGAKVTAAARKRSDLAWIEAFGYQPLEMERLSESVKRFDVIFNTVPACVLKRPCLKNLKAECILLELASLPGGFDEKAVKEFDLRVIEEQGLPGKVAPVSAAMATRNAIYHILEERGASR